MTIWAFFSVRSASPTSAACCSVAEQTHAEHAAAAVSSGRIDGRRGSISWPSPRYLQKLLASGLLPNSDHDTHHSTQRTPTARHGRLHVTHRVGANPRHDSLSASLLYFLLPSLSLSDRKVDAAHRSPLALRIPRAPQRLPCAHAPHTPLAHSGSSGLNSRTGAKAGVSQTPSLRTSTGVGAGTSVGGGGASGSAGGRVPK
ncbi:hypothetical protein B0H11DRAFT_570406 [Mycena galericulata]|nr:hypothetical protein B0H11DRAFT_570406 [Mycena galericulata]